MVKRGAFISLEGGEGVGKSTQLKALACRLEEAGKRVVVTREPGGTPGAEAIRKLLLEGEDDRWTAQSEALLFAAARADHVARLIRPAVERGDWVLCDRFLDSSRAYQGIASGIGDKTVCRLHEIGSFGFLPDRTLILEVDDAETARRLKARGSAGQDRIETRTHDFHNQVRDAFRTFAQQSPDRITMVDASGDAQSVTQRLWLAIADLL